MTMSMEIKYAANSKRIFALLLVSLFLSVLGYGIFPSSIHDETECLATIGDHTVAHSPAAIRSRYGTRIEVNFRSAESIDMSNTTAGVDTSQGKVSLGGTEKYPGTLIITAMDNAHNGDFGGIAGADQLVNQNAAQQGFGASRWKAMLSSSNQHLKDVIPEPYASNMPIVDRNNNRMFNNWNDIFDGSSNWQNNGYLRTFCNREVNEGTGANPDWSDADGWHGSNEQGRFVAGQTCNDWTNVNSNGLATELDGNSVLRQEMNHQGTQTLAVMAIELPGAFSQGDSKLGYVQSKLLHHTWDTIGAARLTWFQNTPVGTDIVYNMTVDGENWITMENGTNHVFEHQGSELKWNATLTTDDPDITPTIYKLIIEYDQVSAPETHKPDSTAWQGTKRPTLEWNFTDPDTADEQSDYLLEVYGDRQMNRTVYNTSWVNDTRWKHTIGGPLEDGIYYWRVRTKDGFHAPGNFSGLKEFRIDVTKPYGNITIADDVHSVNEVLVDLSIAASDSASGVADMQIINDEGRDGPWEEFKTEKRVALSNTDGLKTIGVRFRDNAGIVSEVYNDTVYLDLRGPGDVTVSSITHPDTTVYYNNTAPVFEWEPPYEVTEMKGYSYMVDSSQYTEPGKVLYNENGDLRATYPGEFTGFKDGTWYFHITPCDVYDQWGNTTHFPFNVDTTSPVISGLTPEEDRWFNTTTVVSGAVFTDLGGFGLDESTIQYSVRLSGGSFSHWKDEGMEYDVISEGYGGNPEKIRAEVELELVEGGENAVRWRISDLAENGPVSSRTVAIRVDETPVTFGDPVPAEGDIYTELSVECGMVITDAEGSGVAGSTIEYSISHWGDADELFQNWTNANNNMVRESIQIMLEIQFPPGKHNYIRWRARDAVGNGHAVSEPVRIWINSAPVPRIHSPKDWTVIGEGIPFEMNASGTMDGEGDPLSYFWEIKNKTTKGRVFSASGMMVEAVLDSPGKHVVYLHVSDGPDFNESESVIIEVLGKDAPLPTEDSDGDGLPDWWENLNGLDPKDPGDATDELKARYAAETQDRKEKEPGFIEGNLYLILGIGLVILILIIVFILLIVRGRRKRTEDEPPSPPRQSPHGMERPYPTGARDFQMPGYAQVGSAYQTGAPPPYPWKATPGWGTGAGTMAPSAPRPDPATPQPFRIDGLPDSQPSRGFMPDQARPQGAMATPIPSQQPLLQSSTAGSPRPNAPPALPSYSIPTLMTNQGAQDLNLMALPPAPEPTANVTPPVLAGPAADPSETQATKGGTAGTPAFAQSPTFPRPESAAAPAPIVQPAPRIQSGPGIHSAPEGQPLQPIPQPSTSPGIDGVPTPTAPGPAPLPAPSTGDLNEIFGAGAGSPPSHVPPEGSFSPPLPPPG